MYGWPKYGWPKYFSYMHFTRAVVELTNGQ